MPRATVSGEPTRVVPAATPSDQRVFAAAGGAAQGVLEVLYRLQAFAGADVFDGLGVGFGDVDVHDHAPVAAVHGLAVAGGFLLGDLPLAGDGLEAAGHAGAQREDADAVLAGGGRAAGREGAGDGDGEVGVAVGAEMEAGLLHLEPVGLAGDGGVAGQQRHDGLEAFVHAAALCVGLDAEHVGVGHQGAGAAAEHGPPARHVVELDEALRHEEGVVVGQAGDAGAEADVPGALGGGGDDQLGRGDDLPAGGVMLADPGLVVAQAGRGARASRCRGRWRGWGCRPGGGRGRGRCRTACRALPFLSSLRRWRGADCRA